MNWKILIGGFVVVAGLVALLAAGFGKDPRALPLAMVDKPAPAFDLPVLGEPSRRLALVDFRGRPLVINFWSTWCVPCLQEHRVLMRASERYRDRGVAFLGILFEDQPEAARAFLAERGQAYPTLIDEASRTAVDYGVGGVPETFFIDATGRIRAKYNGPLTAALVDQFLAEVAE